MEVWRTHLLKAARRSSSFKQRLVSALISAVNDSQCENIYFYHASCYLYFMFVGPTNLRHFLCGWLDFLWKSDWSAKTSTKSDVISGKTPMYVVYCSNSMHTCCMCM